MTTIKPDRRLLSNVPDIEKIRTNTDRRGQSKISSDQYVDPEYIKKLHFLSLRYIAEFEVKIIVGESKKRKKIRAHSIDLSATGILIEIDSDEDKIGLGDTCRIKFYIPPGCMPEGFESNVNVPAKAVRVFDCEENGKKRVGFEFEKTLIDYFQKRRWRVSGYSASFFLFVSVLIVILMRLESIIYFKYNIVLYTYSLMTATFLLSRYLFGALYRNVKINPEFTPGVTIIIPCFNEGEWIRRTIISCINQDYPIDKIEIIVVDDCSTDNSPEVIKKTIQDLYNVAERYKTKERVKALLLNRNGGKRVALVEGVKEAKHDYVIFVDSDSFLEPSAVKHLVQPFQDSKMGGVTGRTDVANRYTNYITKMQTVRYYIAFRIMKAAEAYFDCVTCLSGPLSCYRKELVLKYADQWLSQKFLGQPATFGDDRSMTNYIMKTHRTSYQDQAGCSTIVPSKTKVFLRQQMRWKRSWLRESLRAGAIVWKKEPFMALFFYMGLLVPILAPIVVLYNLVYVPIFHGVFPTSFLLGFILMSLLMSFSYFLFQKSRVWLYGMVFCIFYEFVLLWQMPIAWFTFWKSTWGTRETPEDIKEKNKKNLRKEKSKKNNFHIYSKTNRRYNMTMTKIFKTSFFGFNKNEVIQHMDNTIKEYNDLLDQKNKEIEDLKKENAELVRVNDQFRNQINAFAEDKDRIADVLLKAEAKAEEIIKDIYAEADKEKKKLEIELDEERKKIAGVKDRLLNLQNQALEVVNEFSEKVEAIVEYAEEV